MKHCDVAVDILNLLFHLFCAFLDTVGGAGQGRLGVSAAASVGVWGRASTQRLLSPSTWVLPWLVRLERRVGRVDRMIMSVVAAQLCCKTVGKPRHILLSWHVRERTCRHLML